MTEFEQLYLEEYPRLVSYLCRSLPTRDDAEDVAQSEFMKVWENRERVNQPHPYLWKTSRAMLSNWWCKNAGRDDKRVPLELMEWGIQVDEPSDAGMMVDWALSLMTPAQRFTVLARGAGYTYQEIAAVEGHRPRSAEEVMARARMRVKRAKGERDG